MQRGLLAIFATFQERIRDIQTEKDYKKVVRSINGALEEVATWVDQVKKVPAAAEQVTVAQCYCHGTTRAAEPESRAHLGPVEAASVGAGPMTEEEFDAIMKAAIDGCHDSGSDDDASEGAAAPAQQAPPSPSETGDDMSPLQQRSIGILQAMNPVLARSQQMVQSLLLFVEAYAGYKQAGSAICQLQALRCADDAAAAPGDIQ